MTVTKSHAEGLGASLIEDPGAVPVGRSTEIEDGAWQGASLAAMCDHVVAVHHEGLRRELPRIAELLDSVMRIHGPVHLWLRDLPPVFRGLRAELESQLELDERTLFPACRTLDAPGAGAGPGAGAVLDEAPLAAHEEHRRRVGDALAALRRLTADYDVRRALCRTHRRLLEGLRELERDVDRHRHDERDVLLPRVRAVLAARASEAAAAGS